MSSSGIRFSGVDIVEAFIRHTFHNGDRVTFGKRGSCASDNGYIRIWGPTADFSKQPGADDCHIIVELRNSSPSECRISIVEKLAIALGPHAATRGPEFSAGPNPGRFDWEFAPDDSWSTDQIVEKLILAIQNARLPW